jgi:hypothetical protein
MLSIHLSQGEGCVQIESVQGNSRFLNIVECLTKLGELIFEATVVRTSGNGFRIKSDIQRLSQFTTDVSCVGEDPKMQLC